MNAPGEAPSRPARRTQKFDLDGLLKLLGELPVIGLADGRTPGMRRRLAMDELKRAGNDFRGARESLVKTVIEFEDDRQTKLLQARDDELERLLRSRADGRPNKHPVLRDLLVFTVTHRLQSVCGLKVLDARQRTARFFGFTLNFKSISTRQSSTEQVRRLEDRTLFRFSLLQKAYGDEFTKPVLARAARVLDCYVSGAALNHADATRIVSLCRLLEALERSNRIEKTAARKASKRITRQPGKAARPAKREPG
jgi:hypothetical protein